MLKLLRWPQVQDRIPYSRMHVDRLEKLGLFPKRVKLNPDAGQAVAWIEEEIEAFVEQLAARRQGKAVQPPPATAA